MRSLLFILFIPLEIWGQGPFHPDASSPGTSAMHKDSSDFIAWASHAEIIRGYRDIAVPDSGYASVGTEVSCLDNPGSNGVVSLGDGGVAIISFEQFVYDGPGNDFAIFENGFDHFFLELAKVSVSSDGINFFEFESTSLTQDTLQVDPFGMLYASNINNLAGKYKAQYGTPFDLNELTNTPGLDLQHISHVKIEDVIGSIAESYATFDSQGNKINDPYPTNFASGGFDLDAVGVIHQTVNIEETKFHIEAYPNPTSGVFKIGVSNKSFTYSMRDQFGQMIQSGNGHHQISIDLSNEASGIYFIDVEHGSYLSRKKILKL